MTQASRARGLWGLSSGVAAGNQESVDGSARVGRRRQHLRERGALARGHRSLARRRDRVTRPRRRASRRDRRRSRGVDRPPRNELSRLPRRERCSRGNSPSDSRRTAAPESRVCVAASADRHARDRWADDGAMRAKSKVALIRPPTSDAQLATMRTHVRDRRATDRPAVYRMIAADGEIVYVGKSKQCAVATVELFPLRVSPKRRARGSCATPSVSSGNTCRANSPRCSRNCG